jgi:hypothetical protein
MSNCNIQGSGLVMQQDVQEAARRLQSRKVTALLYVLLEGEIMQTLEVVRFLGVSSV